MSCFGAAFNPSADGCRECEKRGRCAAVSKKNQQDLETKLRNTFAKEAS